LHTLETILKNAADWTLERPTVDAFCEQQNIDADMFYNQVSTEIARRFTDGVMSYPDADLAMNRVYEFMIEDAVAQGDGFTLAEPAFSIYEAFDAGEYDHGDGQDPVEAFVKPAIGRILEAT